MRFGLHPVGSACLLTGGLHNAMKACVLVGQNRHRRGGRGMLGWFIVLGAMLFAYGMGYATREIISRMRRRKAEEFRRMRPRRNTAEAQTQV